MASPNGDAIYRLMCMLLCLTILHVLEVCLCLLQCPGELAFPFCPLPLEQYIPAVGNGLYKNVYAIDGFYTGCEHEGNE